MQAVISTPDVIAQHQGHKSKVQEEEKEVQMSLS